MVLRASFFADDFRKMVNADAAFRRAMLCLHDGIAGLPIRALFQPFPAVARLNRPALTDDLMHERARIGACIASGRKRTICVDGDGGFQLNIQELATIAHLQLPIKFFILNNDGYASIRASQANFFGAPSICCSEETGVRLPDYRKVSHAYGLSCAVIEDQRNLREQVRRVLRMPGPVVCDVKVIPDEVRAPRVTSVQRPDGSFVSKPLEDLWPFLDREEFKGNMLVEPVSD